MPGDPVPLTGAQLAECRLAPRVCTRQVPATLRLDGPTQECGMPILLADRRLPSHPKVAENHSGLMCTNCRWLTPHQEAQARLGNRRCARMVKAAYVRQGAYKGVGPCRTVLELEYNVVFRLWCRQCGYVHWVDSEETP